MRPLSASEAITPAIERTKLVLFRPFRIGRSWKLAATAYLAFMGSVFVPVPLAFLMLPWLSTPQGMDRHVSVVICSVVIAVYSVVYSAIFYVGTRLEFALFEIVLFKAEFVAPAWRKYAHYTWPWIGLKAAFSTGLTLAAGIPIAAWLLRVFANFTAQTSQAPSPEFIRNFLLLTVILMGGFSVVFLLSSFFGDLVLPFLALENMPLRVAMSRSSELFKAEPGQFLLFAVFKVLLAIAGFVAMECAVLISEILIAIPLGIVAFLGWLVLHQLGAAAPLMMAVGGILLYAAFTVSIFYVLLGLQGCLVCFFQAFALYFLGGRYPLLGDLLDRTSPLPVNPYAPMFSQQTTFAAPAESQSSPPEAL